MIKVIFDPEKFTKDLLKTRTSSLSVIENLPEGEIKQLITELEPSLKSDALYSFSQFEKWLANPTLARIEWPTTEFKNKGWIRDEDLKQIEGKSETEVYSWLKKICLEKAKIRSRFSGIKRIKTSLSVLSEGITISELLKQNGISDENLKVRCLENRNRIDLAISTGNDRDNNSQNVRNYHGGYDGEKLAMIRSGVNSGQTTYVSDVKMEDYSDFLKKNKYILVYSGEAMGGVGPNGYELSNGFNVFYFTEDDIMKRSLLAVIEIA